MGIFFDYLLNREAVKQTGYASTDVYIDGNRTDLYTADGIPAWTT